ncbi:MAG TPA: hypothetical protein VK939_02535 [Longimicrobiales bacterium]|nr:hypothetical protein [Longimicrobiales bacterium]
MHRRCLMVFSFAALFASAVAGQQPLPPDTARHADSITFRLEPIEVLVSILGSGGPAAGSGVPARALSAARAELAAWRPRLLGDALVRRPAATLYDDLGSPFKQTSGPARLRGQPGGRAPPGRVRAGRWHSHERAGRGEEHALRRRRRDAGARGVVGVLLHRVGRRYLRGDEANVVRRTF